MLGVSFSVIVVLGLLLVVCWCVMVLLSYVDCVCSIWV